MTAANPDFIRQLILDNPCVTLPNGLVRTCPVRLSFPDVFRPGKPQAGDSPDKAPKYSVTTLFPEQVTFARQEGENDPTNFTGVFRAAVGATAKKAFGADVQPSQLKMPFRDQAEKAHVEGYEAGRMFFTATSTQKPLVVDIHQKLITDESRVYPGVWAIVTMNPFDYTTARRGVSFGLRSVMIVCDDEAFGGSGPSDPSVDFGGVKVSAAGLVNKQDLLQSGGASQNASDLF
jgi:hypothetical protein